MPRRDIAAFVLRDTDRRDTDINDVGYCNEEPNNERFEVG